MRTEAATIAIGCSVVLSLATPVIAQNDGSVIRAAQAQDWAAVRSFVKQGANIDAAAPDGATALHWAAYWDDIATVDVLLANRARPNVPNALGVTPLALAAANGNADIVARLIKAGGHPNAASSTGETPLMAAARAGRVEAVQALLAGGANVNATETNQGQTALMWAAAEGHVEVLRALIEARADVNARSRLGFTPLMFVARSGSPAAARVLLDARGEINAVASDFLANAGEVPWMLAAGDYEELHASGSTPLLIAIMSGNYDVAGFLLDAGADMNAGSAGYTPLHASVLHGRMDLVKAVLARGAKVDAEVTKAPRRRILSTDTAFTPGWIGATSLFLAAKFGEPDFVRVLVDAGADPFTRKMQSEAGAPVAQGITAGTTVLMVAAGSSWNRAPGNGSQDRRGRNVAGVLFQEDGRSIETVKTVVELAAKRGPIREWLNAANATGETALHAAATRGLFDVVKYLVEQGADVNAKDKRERTPLALAVAAAEAEKDERMYKTAEVLRTLGAKE